MLIVAHFFLKKNGQEQAAEKSPQEFAKKVEQSLTAGIPSLRFEKSGYLVVVDERPKPVPTKEPKPKVQKEEAKNDP